MLGSFTLRRRTGFGTPRTETTIGQVQFAKDFLATAALCGPSVILHARHLLTTGNVLSADFFAPDSINVRENERE
jgi:hypothetical protein